MGFLLAMPRNHFLLISRGSWGSVGFTGSLEKGSEATRAAGG